MGRCYVTPLMQFEVTLSLFLFLSFLLPASPLLCCFTGGRWKEREVLRLKSAFTFLFVINSVAEEIELRNKCVFGVPDRFK